MTREEVCAILWRDNPASRADEVAMYADCFLDYREAQDNIAKNGNVVAHPRTGSPIDNPYIKVKAAAMSSLRKLNRIKNVTELWK
jgi:phage terminase small subunit